MKTSVTQTGGVKSIALFALVGVCLLLAILLADSNILKSSNNTVSVDLEHANKLVSAKFNQDSITLADSSEAIQPATALKQTNAQIAAQIKAIEESKALQAELVATLSQLKTAFSETSAQLQKSNAKVEALAVQEQSLLAQTDTLNVAPTASEAVSREIDPKAYTIQLASLESFGEVEVFINSLHNANVLNQSFYYYLSKKQVKPWFPVLYGVYKTRDQAKAVRARFPEFLKAKGPIIRQVKDNSQPMIKYP